MKTSSEFRITVLLCAFVFVTGQYAVAKASTPGIVLPEGYSNDDIVALYDDLKQKYPPRDEFETKAAYEKRMQIPYDGKTRFVFVKDAELSVPGGGSGYSFLKYDAEKQKVVLKRLLVSVDGKIGIKRTGYKEEQYEATNAFGAKAIVTEYRATFFRIYVANQDDFKEKIEIQLPPDQARALKENFGILFVCDLKSSAKGYTKEGFNSKKPTFSSPSSYAFSEKHVHVNVVEVVIFNGKTGAIYVKQELALEND